MRRAQGDGNCGSSFSTSCQDWRDVGHRCRASTTGSVGQVLHRKALHSSPSLLLFSPRGHNDRNHRGFGHPVWPPDLRPLALAVPPPARRGLPRRLCLTCAANHGPRGRARHPSRGRVPRAGARRLWERGLPAVPHALLAERERCDAARVGVGRGGPLPGARRRGRAGPGPAAPLDLLPVARRGRPDLPLVPVGRAAARDGAVGGAVRALPATTQPGPRARAFHGDAVARLGPRLSVDVPLRYHEAREWRPHVAPPHRPRLPLLDSTASPLAGVVRAVAPGMDAPGNDARDHRDRAPGAVADRGSRPLGVVGAARGLLVFGQLTIALTGNYGFFNLLGIVLCLSLLDDDALGRVLPLRLAAGDPEPRWKQYAIRGLAPLFALLAALAFAPEIVQTLPGTRGGGANPLLDAVAPLRSVNGYGLFRVMTTERFEIVIEGGADTVHWREYQFRWKPGDPARRPPFVAPHMPRLDWQMWFAALNPEGARDWLVPLLRHLLQGTPEVLDLLGENPFPSGPPRYVRLVYYKYRFSTPTERARGGAWWQRERVGYLTEPLY